MSDPSSQATPPLRDRFQIERERLAAAGPQKWLDSLLPQVEQMRAQLAQGDPRALAARSGATLDDDQRTLHLALWDKEFTLTHPEYIARMSDGVPARADRQALLLIYLTRADGTPPAYRWLRYRELPGGLFYSNAFQDYAEARLARAFHDKLDAFRTAAQRLNGTRLSFGDAAYEFIALPRVRLAAVLWAGDEDFPTSATILFDAATGHYLPIDGASALGSQLVSRLLAMRDDAGKTLTALAVQPPREG